MHLFSASGEWGYTQIFRAYPKWKDPENKWDEGKEKSRLGWGGRKIQETKGGGVETLPSMMVKDRFEHDRAGHSDKQSRQKQVRRLKMPPICYRLINTWSVHWEEPHYCRELEIISEDTENKHYQQQKRLQKRDMQEQYLTGLCCEWCLCNPNKSNENIYLTKNYALFLLRRKGGKV